MPDEVGSTILDDIVSARRLTLEETRLAVPLERVQQMAEERQERRDFAAALTAADGLGAAPGLRVIAELKRASPSRGLLRQNYRRPDIAWGYAREGASALSVLTEERYFLGSLQDLAVARQAVEIPVLRKDFILESYQIYESVAAGADAIVAEPATITGSIGVVYAKFNLGNLLSELGVHFDFVKSAPNSDAMSIARAMTDGELAQLNETIGHLYSAFIAKVAQGRRLSLEQTEAVAKGRIWSGLAAKECGLIDEVGGLSAAVAIARDRAHIAEHQRHQLVTYRAERRWLDLRPGSAEASTPWAIRAAAGALGIPNRWAPAMIEILVRGGVMLLCPFIEL